MNSFSHSYSIISWKVDPKYGLTDADVLIRRTKYGANMLTPPKQTPNWLKFLLQVDLGWF